MFQHRLPRPYDEQQKVMSCSYFLRTVITQFELFAYAPFSGWMMMRWLWVGSLGSG